MLGNFVVCFQMWKWLLNFKLGNSFWPNIAEKWQLFGPRVPQPTPPPPPQIFFFKFLYNFLNKHSSARRWMQMRLEHSGNVPMQSLSLERASLLNPLRSRIILKLDLSILEQLSCVDPDPCQCEVEQLFPLQWAYLFTFWTPSSMPVWLLSS